jgi:RNA polymerase sigma-70 factor (ECF subfamily)
VARRSGGGSKDEALVRALYNTHGHAVLAYATRLTSGDRAAAEDIAQEAFLRAWQHPEVLVAGKDYVRGWLIKVTRNLVIDRVRAQKARPQEVREDPFRPPMQRDHAQGVVDTMAVLDGLGRLSDQHQAVLQQLHILDRSVEEAARALGVPQGTIKSRAARALVALRSEISRSPNGSEERSA